MNQPYVRDFWPLVWNIESFLINGSVLNLTSGVLRFISQLSICMCCSARKYLQEVVPKK